MATSVSSCSNCNNTLLSAIVSLNNCGVQSMKDQHYGQAVTFLTKAIKQLKKLLASTTTTTSSPTSSKQGCLAIHGAEAAAPVVCVYQEEELEGKRTDLNSTVTSPFVLNAPVHIYMVAMPRTMPDHESFQKLSFAMVFNLALTFHLGALQQLQDPSSTVTMTKIKKRFLKALSFYKLAVNTMEQSSRSNMSSSSSMSILEASLAVANNQAHIYSVLGDTEAMEVCQEQVLQCIMLASSHGVSDQIRFLQRFLASITKSAPTAKAA